MSATGDPRRPRCPVIHETSVTPCPVEELTPLLQWLEGGDAVDTARAFPRGTALPGGRLDLCKQSLGPAHATRIMEHLPSHVRHLLLGTDGLGDTGARALATHIERADTLETVYLGCNAITAQGAQALAGALADSERARALWLKRNPLGAEGAHALARMLGRNRHLRTLDLANTMLGDEGVLALTAAIAEHPALERLYLGANGMTAHSAEALGRAVSGHSSLRALYLSTNRLGDEGVRALVRGARDARLTTLSLASNDLGDDGVEDVFVWAAQTGVERLELGTARDQRPLGELPNRLTDASGPALAAFLGADPLLRSLDMRGNRWTTRGALVLEPELSRNRHLVALWWGRHVARRTRRRLRRILDRNAATYVPTPIHPDVQAIQSVYRTAPEVSP